MDIPGTDFQLSQYLFYFFLSHAFISMDVIVGNLTNRIRKRKFYPKKGQSSL